MGRKVTTLYLALRTNTAAENQRGPRRAEEGYVCVSPGTSEKDQFTTRPRASRPRFTAGNSTHVITSFDGKPRFRSGRFAYTVRGGGLPRPPEPLIINNESRLCERSPAFEGSDAPKWGEGAKAGK